LVSYPGVRCSIRASILPIASPEYPSLFTNVREGEFSEVHIQDAE
jgi:hypothetical protein